MTNYLKQSAILRKGWDFIQQIPRAFQRIKAQELDFQQKPPIIVNSFPKSGTHLLVQILEVLPSKDYGTFWSNVPSYTYQERNSKTMVSSIAKLVPGELASAHLFFALECADVLRHKHAVHFFIYRDLRDVVISEAHYLAEMTRWHKLHPYFKPLSPDQRITLAIQGGGENFPYDYPNIAKRFERYMPWILHPEVCAVRFEDLMSEKRQETIHRMMSFYCRHVPAAVSADELTQEAIKNIDPHRSHTFRKGKKGGWETALKIEHKILLKKIAGDLLIQLGYEDNLEW